MLCLRIGVSPELAPALSSCLFDAGARGLLEETDSFTLYAQTEEELAPLLEAVRTLRQRIHERNLPGWLGEPAVERQGDDWDASWLRALGPVPLANGWVLRPTHRTPAPADERTLWFEPSRSFGSGEHVTTRLAAEEIARRARSAPGQYFLDVGAGNGVLSLLALKLGFASAVAVDIDACCVQSCETNATLNGLQDRLRCILGSADAVTETFPVVVANITTPVLLQLAPTLRSRMQDDGLLILTGLLSEDTPSIIERFTALGLRLESRRDEDEWGLLVFC